MMAFGAIPRMLAFLLLAGLWFPVDLTAQKSVPQSQCIACHTDLKKLMRLCWEIEKIRPKPRASAETSGEG
jgi:hypothetical protein